MSDSLPFTVIKDINILLNEIENLVKDKKKNDSENN